MTVVFPWYLFNKKNKDVVNDKEMIPKIHQMTKDKIKEENLKGEELKRFVDKINELFRNKIGEDWININYE